MEVFGPFAVELSSGVNIFCQMSVTHVRPSQSQLFYVPQKPYMSPGTLRDQVTKIYVPIYTQVTYPLKLDSSVDTRIAGLMELVELSYLIERESWDSVKDWGDVLSGGEKQRVNTCYILG